MSAHRRALLRALLLVLLASALAWRLTDTSAVIATAAFGPAIIYATLVALLDRRDRARTTLSFAAFLCGAVLATSLAGALNDRLPAWIGRVVPSADAHLLAPMLGAPVVEEAAKSVVLLVLLLLWREQTADARDGIVRGALVGLGFAAMENVLYLSLAALQGGPAGLARGIYLRGVLYGLNHAAFTATTGAALGAAQRNLARLARAMVVGVGFGLAVAQHVLWNAVASEAIINVLCSPLIAGGPCRSVPSPSSLYVTAPILVAVFIGPGVVTLLAITALPRSRP